MSISEKLASMTPKNRQYLLLGAAAAGILILASISASLMGDPAPPTPTASTELQATNIATPGAAADPKDVWMEQSSAQMKEMNDVIKGLKEQMADLEHPKPEASPPESLLPSLPPLTPTAQSQQPLEPIPAIEPLQPIPAREPGIASFEVSQAAAQPEAVPDANVSYIPAGTFVRVALLGGLDAPTGGQAQNNPHPILMRAQDNAFLPNRYRFEIKECFLLASSYGDISSERAIARLENISCVRNDGTAVDVNVKGDVVGEDGKAGMRGRLISKQGQVLANALLAGIGSGIGQAFQASATTQSVSALGSTSTTNTGQQIQNGVGSGVGKALDRLSQYYIGLAEKLFPIIEIDAGRIVEVVFTKGFSMEANKQEQSGTYSDLWVRAKTVMGDAIPMNDAVTLKPQN
ncbi:MAG: TraB/VirB10 family protein [Sideroxyarcus sp.]|nr:TraB/VirB10 family protein [Sideroxyarcus sp.]